MANKFFIIASIVLVLGFGYWILAGSISSDKNTKPVKIVSADIYTNKQVSKEFQGEKGENLTLTNGQVSIPSSGFETNQVRYFNAEVDGKKIYFMVVKDSSGVYRAAANACEVCFGAHKGFRQEGDKIICNNCGNSFSLDTLGVVKGGCNPGPVNPNVPQKDGQLIIKADELKEVINLF